MNPENTPEQIDFPDDQPKLDADHAESAPPETPAEQPNAETAIRHMSRRSFIWAAVAVAGTVTGIRWLGSRQQDNGLSWPLRRAYDVNDDLAREIFAPDRLAKTYPRERAVADLRVNGDLGLSGGFDPDSWRLMVTGLAGMQSEREFSLADIKALPKVVMTTELKCIEGWSEVVNWGGARLADFIRKYPPATTSGDPANFDKGLQDLPAYVGLATPDEGYYVGLDLLSALHPQTLLCYEMNGQPLTLDHGAPLRLAIPVKYGIKNIKRIGTLTYTNQRPADYWAERGYGYHAGH